MCIHMGVCVSICTDVYIYIYILNCLLSLIPKAMLDICSQVNRAV